MTSLKKKRKDSMKYIPNLFFQRLIPPFHRCFSCFLNKTVRKKPWAFQARRVAQVEANGAGVLAEARALVAQLRGPGPDRKSQGIPSGND